MTLSKILLVVTGFILLALGLIGIVLPVLPTTPFLLAASFCFMKSSSRLYRWIMGNRFLGPRITRITATGLTKKEKLSIYFFVCLLIIPVIVLTSSFYLRIFLIVLLAIKALVFMRIKTAPETQDRGETAKSGTVES
ncbi:MAG: YbaN family protein [Spirochaetaceae bacterium]|nr:YbaN family protein [Spirochaetaceae bacterium]